MEEVNYWLIGGGIAVGIAFGALAQRFRFCMVAATANWMLIHDTRQISAFAAAFLSAFAAAALFRPSTACNSCLWPHR